MTSTNGGTALHMALVAAQSEMKNPALDAVNPHFKNRYASLMGVREAVVPVMNKHGISVVQCPISGMIGDKVAAGVKTMLIHTSGDSIESDLLLPIEKPNAQGVGSAITYARRYALLAFAGLVGDPDDDGNDASTPPPAPQRTTAPKPADGSPRQALLDKVRLWTGIADPNDLNAATKQAIVASGVVLKPGQKLTDDQALGVIDWVGKQGRNWQEVLKN